MDFGQQRFSRLGPLDLDIYSGRQTVDARDVCLFIETTKSSYDDTERAAFDNVIGYA